MSNLEIKIIKKDENFTSEVIETDGYLLFFLEGNKVKMKGQMDVKALAPIMTKIIMEKMAHVV